MVSISPASASDLPRLAEIQRLAFSGSRIQELCFGKCTAEDSDANTVARLLKAIDDPEQAVWKAVKDDQIVGLALWGLPHEYKEEPKPEEETEEQRLAKLKARFPAGADYELCNAFFATLDLGIKDPHFHLGICVVDPRVQRSGAGSALVRWGCAQADKLGVDAYLEASDVGIRTYEKAGFARIREPIRGGPDGSMVVSSA